MRWLIRSKLKSTDPEIRQEAIDKLKLRAGVEDVHGFARCLCDENALVRRAAVSAIVVLRETAAEPCIQALLPWLKDQDFALRGVAANALDLLGWRPATSEDRVLNAIAQGNFNSISAKEEAALDILLPLLKYKSQSIRFAVAQTLEQAHFQDPRIVQPLIELSKDAHLPVCITALQALSDSSDERRLPTMLAMLKNPAPQARAIAVEAIGKAGKPEYLGKILPLLKDTNFEVRLAAIKALGQLQAPEAFEPLVAMLTDADTDVRKATIESLARLRDPRSLKALLPMLIDAESLVRHAAANAIQIINPDWQASKEAQESIPFLEESLKHDEYWVRDSAAKTLKRIRDL